MKTDKKTTGYRLRLTESELVDMKAKAEAAGVSLSELVRESVKRTRTWTIADKKALRENTRAIAYLSSILANLSRTLRLNPGSQRHLQELNSAMERLDTLFQSQKKGGSSVDENL